MKKAMKVSHIPAREMDRGRWKEMVFFSDPRKEILLILILILRHLGYGPEDRRFECTGT